MIEIVLITDKQITELNYRSLGRRRPTDVMTFDYGKMAEIYISVDTARRQAKERGVKLEYELMRLIIHGILHIDGYDDISLDAFCGMRTREWNMLIRCLCK